MLLHDMSIAFADKEKDYRVLLFTGNRKERDKIKPGFQDGIRRLYIKRLSNRDIAVQNEGIYTTEDIKMYQQGKPDIPAFSIVLYENEQYEVKPAHDRSADGGFSTYYAKLKRKHAG